MSKFKFWQTLPSCAKEKRNLIVAAAELEALFIHPGNTPYSLICPIGQGIMKCPVITHEGFVYDRDNILRSLKLNSQDPQSRNSLTPEQLTPFPELLPAIATFTNRQNDYKKLKAQLIKEARMVSHGTPLDENPELFICPLSKRQMQVPVITFSGKVVDRSALTLWLLENPEDKEFKGRSGSEIYQPFPEFHEQIKLYLFYLNQQRERALEKESKVHSVQRVSRCNFFAYLASFLISPEEQNHTMQLKQ